MWFTSVMALYVVVKCKSPECGRLIFDTVYTTPGVIAFRIKESIRCRCGHVGQYDGDDFEVKEVDPEAEDLAENPRPIRPDE
jgi:hypothetical protein